MVLVKGSRVMCNPDTQRLIVEETASEGPPPPMEDALIVILANVIDKTIPTIEDRLEVLGLYGWEVGTDAQGEASVRIPTVRKGGAYGRGY